MMVFQDAPKLALGEEVGSTAVLAEAVERFLVMPLDEGEEKEFQETFEKVLPQVGGSEEKQENNKNIKTKKEAKKIVELPQIETIKEEIENKYNDSFVHRYNEQPLVDKKEEFNEDLPKETNESKKEQISDKTKDNVDIENILHSEDNNLGKIIKIEMSVVPKSRNSGQCNICIKPYLSRGMMVKHFKVAHTVSSNDIIPCDYCIEWFPSNSELTEHMQYHDITKDPLWLFCNQCNYSIKTKSSLRRKQGRGNQMMIVHMEKHKYNSLSYSCDQCGKEYTTKDTLRRHTNNMHADFIFTFNCDICDSNFKSPKYLQVHILEDHKKEFNYQCSTCEKKYVNEEKLRMHMRVHVSAKMFCEDCGKRYKTKTKLRDHVMMNHSNKEDLPFACTQLGCGRRFVNNSRLTTHRIIHTDDKPFKCKICDSVFRRRNHLDKHSKLHTGERPHVCNYCGKGFIQKSNLNLHKEKCDISAKASEEK